MGIVDQLNFGRLNKIEGETAFTDKKRRVLGDRQGMTGERGDAAVLAGNPDADAIMKVMRRLSDEKNQSKAENAPSKAENAVSLRLAGSVLDKDGLPTLYNPKTGETKSLVSPSPLTPKLTGENAGAASRAASGYAQVKQVPTIIDKVAKAGKFGLLKGGVEKWLAGNGIPSDPDVAELVGYLDSIAKFGIGIHGMRNIEGAKDTLKKIFVLQSDPETMKAALKPIQKAFAERAMAMGPGAAPYFKGLGIEMDEIREFIKPPGTAEKPGAGKKVYRGDEALKRLGIK
jgi:hypothetical protein